MADERIVAVGLLTQREVDLLGKSFSRLWPVDDTPCFADLIEAIDRADEELKMAHQLQPVQRLDQ
ncbi:hypothetical protein [Sphingomonas daechungensis]|uniref:Uncharacterized protein n=1 Tax=Sphingomonas daechungensis TaxID=1176646 RepID=A0ABX6T0U7_9SPHN|nr:hypothetical protein [Sphingomonas daechungensis]QNP42838.1 hypothetical protein H9L15_12305 [Sphingomonas daechungensis]